MGGLTGLLVGAAGLLFAFRAVWHISVLMLLTYSYLVLYRCVRSGLYLDGQQLVVRNPLPPTRVVTWNAVSGFRVGRKSIYPRVAFMDLLDGTSIHIWALQAPSKVISPNDDTVERAVEELNSLLATQDEVRETKRSEGP
jgi:hypothetical protein